MDCPVDRLGPIWSGNLYCHSRYSQLHCRFLPNIFCICASWCYFRKFCPLSTQYSSCFLTHHQVRNIVGCAFPLFAEQMYTKLGLEWASTLLAFLAILCIPVPFLFFFKGETIRMKSPWAREHYYTNEDKPH